jgi:hypothetical protein
MKYFLMASAFALTACSFREVKVTNQYEVTCPVTIQLAKVDTITGYKYKYYERSLTIYGIEFREYPPTCVVSMINAGGGY